MNGERFEACVSFPLPFEKVAISVYTPGNKQYEWVWAYKFVDGTGREGLAMRKEDYWPLIENLEDKVLSIAKVSGYDRWHFRFEDEAVSCFKKGN